MILEWSTYKVEAVPIHYEKFISIFQFIKVVSVDSAEATPFGAYIFLSLTPLVAHYMRPCCNPLLSLLHSLTASTHPSFDQHEKSYKDVSSLLASIPCAPHLHLHPHHCSNGASPNYSVREQVTAGTGSGGAVYRTRCMLNRTQDSLELQFFSCMYILINQVEVRVAAWYKSATWRGRAKISMRVWMPSLWVCLTASFIFQVSWLIYLLGNGIIGNACFILLISWKWKAVEWFSCKEKGMIMAVLAVGVMVRSSSTDHFGS